MKEYLVTTRVQVVNYYKVSLTEGEAKMSPREILDIIYAEGILPYYDVFLEEEVEFVELKDAS